MNALNTSDYVANADDLRDRRSRNFEHFKSIKAKIRESPNKNEAVRKHHKRRESEDDIDLYTSKTQKDIAKLKEQERKFHEKYDNDIEHSDAALNFHMQQKKLVGDVLDSASATAHRRRSADKKKLYNAKIKSRSNSLLDAAGATLSKNG